MPGAVVITVSEYFFAENVAFYGKIPSVGDFVSRNLSHHQIQFIDQWFSEGMAYVKHAKPDDWLDIYLTAPVWNFIIASGIWGKEYWCGSLMPSVDSVGRYFPFIAFINTAASAKAEPALPSYLSTLSNKLPILLQGNLPPEVICDFLAGKVSSAMSSDSAVSLEMIEFDTGRSYWWCEPQMLPGSLSIIHDGLPTQQLFKQLFIDF